MGILNPFGNDDSGTNDESEEGAANIGREIENTKAALNRLVETLREANLHYEDRLEVVQQYPNVLNTILALIGDNRQIRWIPPEKEPKMDEMAELVADASEAISPEFFETAEPVKALEAIQSAATHLESIVEEKPEFPYPYEEIGRKPVHGHEIQSFGVPHDIDQDRLPEGEDGVEVYSCGRALEMMDELAKDPKSALWLGLGTRNGRDVGIEKSVLFRHRAIFGQTGYGKSTLLTNDARQLIQSGAGMCFIDPKGDDSKRLMQIIPEDRKDDVVWIEPSSEGEYLSGFNYISMSKSPDDPGYEVARANLVDDLKKMLKMSAEYWGPRMDRVAMNLITAMNMYNDRTPDDAPEMNLVDLYEILKSDASRKEFAARVKKAGLYFVDDYTQMIAEMDNENLEPLLGRFIPWIQNPVARRMIGFRAGGVNIPKAIDNDKIIIVRMGAEPRDLKQMLGMAVIRRIWSHIRSRSQESIYERKPFYLFVDEFDNIALEDDTIPAIISESRSMRLSFNIANQYPDQLPSNVVDAITTNCDTIISFNPGDMKSAKTYNTQLGLKPETLTDEVNYHVWLRTTLKGNMEKSDAFRAYVFPPFPPLRTVDKAEEWIEASLKEYGRRRRSDEEIHRNLLFNSGDGKWETGIGKEIVMAEDDELKMVLEAELEAEMPPPESPEVGSSTTSGAGTSLKGTREAGSNGESDLTPEEQFVEDQKKTILESIFATALQNGKEPTEYVPTALVKKEVKTRLPDDAGTSLSELSNMFETMDFDLVDLERVDGKSQIRLTKRGEAKVFDHDTGSAGSGGGDDHRWVLREAFVAFTKLGYHTWLPEQDGGELPDGVAEAPIDITDIDPNLSPNEFAQELEKRKQRLKEEYPAVWELAGANDLSVEAETSTIKYPFQTFHNLRKAKERGDLCVFAVKDMSAEKDDFAYWARRGEQAIYETQKSGRSVEIIDDTVSFRKRDRDGTPTYYNQGGSAKYEIESGETALRPKTDAKGTLWYYDTGTDEVVCVPSTSGQVLDGAEEIRFENEEAVVEGDRSAVPAYYEYDQNEKEYVVYSGGEKLHYPTEEEMLSEWERFNKPFIPEAVFDEMPTKDDFIIVIFPDKDSEYDQPQIYDRGELTSLFDALGADLTMPELGDLEELPDDDLEGEQSTDVDDGEGPVKDTDETAAPVKRETQPQDAHGQDVGGPDEDNNGSTARPTISPKEIADHSGNDYTTEQVATFATGTALPRGKEFDRFISAAEAVDPAAAAAIDEPDDIPNVVGVPTLEEVVADEQQEDTPDSADPRVESDSESGSPTAECSNCGEISTFSEDDQWGTLACDRCGYTPKASVREEIKQDRKADQEQGEPSTDVADSTSAGGSGREEQSDSAQEAKGVDSIETDSTSQASGPAGVPYDCPGCNQEQVFSRDDEGTFTCEGCGHELNVRAQRDLKIDLLAAGDPVIGENDTGTQEEPASNSRPDDEPVTEAETHQVGGPEPPEEPQPPEVPESPEHPEAPEPPEPLKESEVSKAPKSPEKPEVTREPEPPETPKPPEPPKEAETPTDEGVRDSRAEKDETESGNEMKDLFEGVDP